jgi:hypothetical protein
MSADAEKSGLRASRSALLTGFVLGLAIACAPPAEEAEVDIEVVDVIESVDSRIRPEDDIRAEVRERGLLGVLPGDFPSDFWVYRPASIVDIGDAGGRAFVSLRATGRAADIADRLRMEQADRGWSANGGAEGLAFTKQGRQVDVSFEPQGNETWVRIEFAPE